MKTNYLITVLLILFLYSCQNDDPEIDIPQTDAIENIDPHDIVEDDPGIQRMAFKDLISDDLFTKLTLKYDVAQFYDFNINRIGASTFSIENATSNNVVVVTDTVNVVSRENYNSYTLLVKTDDGTTKNLLLEEGENGDNAFLLTYDIEYTYTAEGREFSRGTMYMEPFNGTVQVENSIGGNTTSSTGQTCRWIKATEWIQCACGHWTRPPCKGCDGGWPRFPEQREYWVEICSDFGGGGGSGEIFTTENTDEYPSGGGSPSSGPGGGQSSETAMITDTTVLELTDLIINLNLNDEEINWLSNNLELADFFRNLLARRNSSQAVDYIKSIIEAGIDGTVLSVSPFVKYPKNSKFDSIYPKLTNLLMNEIPKIAENEKIVNRIKEITDAPIEIIKEALQWGKGPEIHIEQLGGQGEDETLGSYRGHIDPTTINKLFLDIDLVNTYENSTTTIISDAMSFLIAVTILHEYNHLGDFVFGEHFWGELYVEDNFDPNSEAGNIFEVDIFGELVTKSNAGLILKRIGGLFGD